MYNGIHFKEYWYLYKMLKMKSVAKPVEGGTKSPVSDERVHGRLLLSFIYISIQKKNNLLTSDIYYVWKGIDF